MEELKSAYNIERRQVPEADTGFRKGGGSGDC